jgi:hypothetical protein
MHLLHLPLGHLSFHLPSYAYPATDGFCSPAGHRRGTGPGVLLPLVHGHGWGPLRAPRDSRHGEGGQPSDSEHAKRPAIEGVGGRGNERVLAERPGSGCHEHKGEREIRDDDGSAQHTSPGAPCDTHPRRRRDGGGEEARPEQGACQRECRRGNVWWAAVHADPAKAEHVGGAAKDEQAEGDEGGRADSGIGASDRTGCGR